jgi:hypothetical protein
VHPTIAALLGALKPAGLRLWHDNFADDDVAAARIRPDFCATHVRDAAASTLGAALIVEVKLPGTLKLAARQARIYLRRRVYKICCERNERGEAMDSVVALGAATDGCDVIVLRMLSGAPRAGGSFRGATPCPVLQSGPLALLGAWDFRGKPAAFLTLAQPPPGFVALWHLLCAAAELAKSEVLEALDVSWDLPGSGTGGEAGGAAHGAAGGAPCFERLALTGRLGSGGSSDTYRVEPGAYNGGSAGAFVLKAPRFMTNYVQVSFAAEASSLEALAGAAADGLVPTLVARGRRLPGWPALLQQPCGQPLAEWVAGRAAAEAGRIAQPSAAAAGAERPVARAFTAALAKAAAARLACARAITLRVLDALERAHAKSIVHCDVRPSNVVVSCATAGGEENALLVDWGSSRKLRADAHGCGVEAYADERVFSQGSFAARPAQDAAGALFTFLAVAFGPDCCAPWIAPGMKREADVFLERDKWLQQHSKGSTVIVCIADALVRVGSAACVDPCATARAAVESVAVGMSRLRADSGP